MRAKLLQDLSQSYVPFATVHTTAIAPATSINAVCVAASVTMFVCHVHVPDAIINTATMIVSILKIGYISNIMVNLSDLLEDAADCVVKVTVHCRRVRAQDVLHVTSALTVLLLLQRIQRQLARDATCGTEQMCALRANFLTMLFTSRDIRWR